MRYVPKALALWPAGGPSLGKKSLPRREGVQGGQASRGGQASFLADVLGELQAEARPQLPGAAPPADAGTERPMAGPPQAEPRPRAASANAHAPPAPFAAEPQPESEAQV